VLGTLIGVVFLGVVQNGLTLSDVSSFWHGTVSGVILIVAVGLGVRRGGGWRWRGRRLPPPPSSEGAE
jgi:ribose/xylose/arabinose/galactoside ABC-type transport system permease subunit